MAINGGGDTIFWIVITVILTIYLAKKGVMKLLLTNPIALTIFIIVIVLVYVVFTALQIAFGIGDAIDNSITGLATFIQGAIS